jgi:hypothetical protein
MGNSRIAVIHDPSGGSNKPLLEVTPWRWRRLGFVRKAPQTDGWHGKDGTSAEESGHAGCSGKALI